MPPVDRATPTRTETPTVSRLADWARRLVTSPAPETPEQARWRILEVGGWTCHGCDDARPDEMIAVMSDTQLVRGIEVRRNLRYCVDRPSCGKAVAAKLDDLRARALDGEGGA
jgi:hypothetical protein